MLTGMKGDSRLGDLQGQSVFIPTWDTALTILFLP